MLWENSQKMVDLKKKVRLKKVDKVSNMWQKPIKFEVKRSNVQFHRSFFIIRSTKCFTDVIIKDELLEGWDLVNYFPRYCNRGGICYKESNSYVLHCSILSL